MKKIKLATKRTCTGCLACIDACKHNAINYFLGSDGHYYVKINKNSCTQCGLCMKTCPVISDFNYSSNTESHVVSLPHAAWTYNQELRKKSSSGGIFAALAQYILKKNGVVIGVCLEESISKHIIIENIGDLYKIQGSKYQQSNTHNIYKKTQEILKTNRLVLFSGTGCQIAGLISFLKGKNYPNLVTIDLICGGVPSQLLVRKYINNQELKIVSYRSKDNQKGPHYKLQIEDKNHIVFTPKDEYFIINAFSNSLTNRYSCFNCKFCGINRKSDITIGDFWGDTDFTQEHNKGLSLVITHSSKGLDILQKSDIEIHETTWRKCLPKNPRICIGKIPFLGFSFERIFISTFFKRLSYSHLSAIYSGIYSNRIQLIYKLNKFIYYKIKSIYFKKKIEKYLK